MFRHFIIGRLIISVPFKGFSRIFSPRFGFDSNEVGDRFFYLYRYEFIWCVLDGIKMSREYDNLDNGYTKNGFRRLKDNDQITDSGKQGIL